MLPPREVDQPALAYLERLSRFGMRLGLERMRAILDRLGRPQRAFASVHVAGTNGKGSTAAMLASILRAAGLRVGLYTSPHLQRFHERISVDGQPISPEELARAAETVRQAVEAVGPAEPPTHFEFTTAMAFWHMAQKGVQLAVVEVGLGGRLDATNVIEPQLCVITPVGLDHTGVLGSTLEAVAAEKAGIIKPGVPVVVAPQAPAALQRIAARASELGSPLYGVRRVKGTGPFGPERGAGTVGRGTYWFLPREANLQGGRVDVRGPDGFALEGVRVALLGSHQLENAAVALAAAHRLARDGGWPIGPQAMREGLARVEWPARLQVLSRSPYLVLDGAHNPQAARALARALVELFGALPPVIVVGMLAEKDAPGFLSWLVTPASVVVATRPASGRTAPADPEGLARLARSLGSRAQVAVAPAQAAVELGLRLARRLGPAVVTGSLYLSGEVLAAWRPAGIDRSRR